MFLVAELLLLLLLSFVRTESRNSPECLAVVLLGVGMHVVGADGNDVVLLLMS